MQERASKPPKQTAEECLAELQMRRLTKRNPNLCMLLVEGPGDRRALSQLETGDSIINPCYGKAGVLEVMETMLEGNQGKHGGLIGLVDRDFDHFVDEPEPLSARVGWISHLCCDLEASVLRFNAARVIQSLMGDTSVAGNSWLTTESGIGLLDRLVVNIASPIGRLRAALLRAARKLPRGRFPPSLENGPDGKLLHPLPDQLWSASPPSEPPTDAALVRLLPDKVKYQLRDDTIEELVHDDIRGLQDPWSTVRGKDLVRALALALDPTPHGSSDRVAMVTARASDIQRKIVDCFDDAVAARAGVFDAVQRASGGDHRQYRYLGPRQSA